ncbi:unnamed protein product [Closterium sp. Naga37s-1]|nr:unnamed protein product [Closterium sp. Naga37s-1]
MALHLPSHALTARLSGFTEARLFGLRVTCISPARTAAHFLTLASPPCAQPACAPIAGPRAQAGTAQADAGRADSATGAAQGAVAGAAAGAVRAAAGDGDRGAREAAWAQEGRAAARGGRAAPESESSLEPGSVDGFHSLGLPAGVTERVASLGLLEPTDIQRRAVPALMQGTDAVLQSFTGSGKTLAYLLPILASVGPLSRPPGHADTTGAAGAGGGEGDGDGKGKRGKKGRAGGGGGGGGGGVEAVVVAPSRELAMQIVREAERVLGEKHKVGGKGGGGEGVRSIRWGERGGGERGEEHKRCVQQLIGGANPPPHAFPPHPTPPPLAPSPPVPGSVTALCAAGEPPPAGGGCCHSGGHTRCVQQLIGGANPHRQEEALKKYRPAIVVGTPGRIAESSRAGRLSTHSCRWLVLDEADMLLSHRFRMDMLRILDHVGRRKSLHHPAPSTTTAMAAAGSRAERQLVMVSATVPRPVLEAACKWGNHPTLVQQHAVQPIDPRSAAAAAAAAAAASVAGSDLLPVPAATASAAHGALVIPPPAAVLAGGVAGGLLASLGGGEEGPLVALRGSLPPNLEHCYIVVNRRHHVDIVRRCVHALEARSAMVFMNFGRRLVDVQHKLEARGLSAAALHGTISKLARTNIMSSFRDGGVRVLLATEVGARGLDVVACDLVVNLELPASPAHYAHRAGRTGRLGRRGVVVSVCEEREEFVVLRVARELGVKMARMEVVEGSLVPYEGRMKY